MSTTDRQIAFQLACVVAVFLALFHRGHFNSTDELGLYFQTRALAEEGSLAVPAGLHMAAPGRGGASYSHYTIGQSLLAMPFHAAGRLVEPLLSEAALRAFSGTTGQKAWGGAPPVGFGAFPILFYPAAATGALVALFFLAERQLGASRRTALAASLALAASTQVALQSTYFLQHTTEALGALGAFTFWHRFRSSGRARDVLLGSVFASSIPNVRAAGAISGIALGGYLAFLCVERLRREGLRPLVPALFAALAPLLVSVALYGLANQLKWGTWLESPMLAERSKLGADPRQALAGFLVSPGMSVFVYTPLLALLPASFPRFWREHRAEASAVLALFATSLAFYSSYKLWTGLFSCPGPRYLFTALVFLMLPLGPWLERATSARARAAFAALFGAGAFVQLVSTTVAWGDLVIREGYRRWRPPFGFLWDGDTAPLAAAWRLFGEPLYVDVWAANLALGWPGQPAAPGLAFGAVALWAAGLGVLALRLWRTLRAAPSEAHGASASAGASST